MSEFVLKSFALGSWMTNGYLLGWEPTKEAWVVDPGFSPDPLVDYIQQEKWIITKILLTHAHLDHIAGINNIVALFPEAEILIHKEEETFLTDPSLNLSALAGVPVSAPEPTGTLADGDELVLGGLSFTVLHTPGHSPGGACFYQPREGILLSGDTLFEGSVGRTDFPTSDAAALGEGIRRKLYVLPDETKVYPGHGPETQIGREKRFNPFVKS